MAIRKRKLCAALCVLGCLLPGVAHADAGIPMLVVAWPTAWLAFFPVVLIETVVAMRVFRTPFREVLRPVAEANLVSTLLGIPVTWGLLAAVEMTVPLLLSATAPERLDGRWAERLMSVLSLPWLPPIEGQGNRPWLLAAAALCVPFFFMSVFVERRVFRRRRPMLDRALVHRWAWLANAASYAPQVGFWLVLAAFSSSRGF